MQNQLACGRTRVLALLAEVSGEENVRLRGHGDPVVRALGVAAAARSVSNWVKMARKLSSGRAPGIGYPSTKNVGVPRIPTRRATLVLAAVRSCRRPSSTTLL